MENVKLVSEQPPNVLVEQTMLFFGVTKQEAIDYLVSERKKWNEKHQEHMTKILEKDSSKN